MQLTILFTKNDSCELCNIPSCYSKNNYQNVSMQLTILLPKMIHVAVSYAIYHYVYLTMSMRYVSYAINYLVY